MINGEARKRTQIITESTVITDTDFSGWMAVNTGNANVIVDDVELQPTQGLNFLTAIPPTKKYLTPIRVQIPTPGGRVILSQLIFSDTTNPINRGDDNEDGGCERIKPKYSYFQKQRN